jgi:hypothetical protein
MTQAQNYKELFDGGYKKQACELTENMSISKLQDWKNESTVFVFADESAIFTSGSDFRLATENEKG